MTPTLERCLAFIEAQIEESGRSPTVTAIADHMGVTRARASQMVNSLVGHNRVVRTGSHERNIEIVGAGLYQLTTASLLAELLRRETSQLGGVS